MNLSSSPGIEQIEKLRRALHKTDPDDRPAHDAVTRAAAVLVPIVHRDDDLHLVFIRRSDSVESHRGQVAFPGGRVDPTDTTLLHTALREAHEEVGIEPHLVDVLGGFPTMSTVSSGMRVAPFVGLLKRPVDYRIQEVEVAQVFEVPLRVLADPNYRGQYEWRRDKDRPSSNFPAIFYAGSDDLGPHPAHHGKSARHHGDPAPDLTATLSGGRRKDSPLYLH